MAERPPTLPRLRRESDAPGLQPGQRAILRMLEDNAEAVSGLAKKLEELALRVGGLEIHRAHLTGAEDVRAKVRGWVLGVVAVILTGIIMLALRGAMKP
jgi:hypothetical protein